MDAPLLMTRYESFIGKTVSLKLGWLSQQEIPEKQESTVQA